MEHYSVEEWADFVRGVVAESETAQMRLHLAGCSRCQAEVDWLNRVEEWAQLDRQFEVPQEVVRQARSIFPAKREGWAEALHAIVAELVFSAGQNWQPVGVRTAATAGQRLLYRAAQYSIDLAIDTNDAENASEIVGQITNRDDASEPLDKIPVQVVVGRESMGETETNEFGEFVLRSPGTRNLILRFAFKNVGRRIDVPVKLTLDD